jgi:hypothetical protein
MEAICDPAGTSAARFLTDLRANTARTEDQRATRLGTQWHSRRWTCSDRLLARRSSWRPGSSLDRPKKSPPIVPR